MNKLEVSNLHVEVLGKEILKGISFTLDTKEVLVIMGPNGAGKSTLSNCIMGHPNYKITKGNIFFNGVDITNLSADKKAKLCIFMSFQTPIEITGVTFTNFLRTSYNAVKGTDIKLGDFTQTIKEKMEFLSMDPKFRTRSVNVGFSGGEKKRAEILQMMLLEPKFAMLDEIDSGLDVDALKIVAKGINYVREKNNTSVMLITHNNKILDYIKPDKVIVLKNGKIIQEGGFELAKKIHDVGFEN